MPLDDAPGNSNRNAKFLGAMHFWRSALLQPDFARLLLQCNIYGDLLVIREIDKVEAGDVELEACNAQCAAR
ncbi:MAG: hypothetical protein WA792_02875 [Pseudolabrys sp.]